jgi:hypothetical protein
MKTWQDILMEIKVQRLATLRRVGGRRGSVRTFSDRPPPNRTCPFQRHPALQDSA